MDPLLLVGAWDFRRTVSDHRDGVGYTAEGEAWFSLDDDGRVRWVEQGILRWASSASTPVSRTLFLVRGPSADDAAMVTCLPEQGPDDGSSPAWRVTFEDGRDFHPWTVGGVEHLCGRDLYRGGVAVEPDLPASNLPASNLPWELRWRVTGPEKDYTMHTAYSRRSPCT